MSLSKYKLNKKLIDRISASIVAGRVFHAYIIEGEALSDKEGFVKKNGMECMECGCCSYVCPAGKPLVQNFKQLRRTILDERRKR